MAQVHFKEVWACFLKKEQEMDREEAERALMSKEEKVGEKRREQEKEEATVKKREQQRREEESLQEEERNRCFEKKRMQSEDDAAISRWVQEMAAERRAQQAMAQAEAEDARFRKLLKR